MAEKKKTLMFHTEELLAQVLAKLDEVNKTTLRVAVVLEAQQQSKPVGIEQKAIEFPAGTKKVMETKK
jgi:hypothetical protein